MRNFNIAVKEQIRISVVLILGQFIIHYTNRASVKTQIKLLFGNT